MDDEDNRDSNPLALILIILAMMLLVPVLVAVGLISAAG
jgi:hypothetical protein